MKRLIFVKNIDIEALTSIGYVSSKLEVFVCLERDQWEFPQVPRLSARSTHSGRT